MRSKLAASAAVALLVATGSSLAHAEKSKKKNNTTEVPTSINKQFQWEDKVVGPSAGLDHNRIAAIQEKGRREDAARKKEPPKKIGRAEGVEAPASSTLPTMDIEKPAAAGGKKSKKVAAAEPKRKDALDDLLDSEGVKPDNPKGGKTGGQASGSDGLGSLLASDDKPAASTSNAASATKKSSKKHRHGN